MCIYLHLRELPRVHLMLCTAPAENVCIRIGGEGGRGSFIICAFVQRLVHSPTRRGDMAYTCMRMNQSMMVFKVFGISSLVADVFLGESCMMCASFGPVVVEVCLQVDPSCVLYTMRATKLLLEDQSDCSGTECQLKSWRFQLALSS